MVDSSRVMEQAEALLRRTSPEAQRMRTRARTRRWRALLRRFKIAFLAVLGVMFAAGLFGSFVAPLGIGGVMLTFVAMIVMWLTIILWPRAAEPTPQALVQTDIRLLPQRTEEWLERQRPALPAPAARLVDGIGIRLEALAPQLQTLDPSDPAAFEVRKLVGEELPELIDGYIRVPAALRRDARDGKSPDAQLVQGLQLVDEELQRMTAQLASGDLHKLATQGRFLELKYRGVDGA